MITPQNCPLRARFCENPEAGVPGRPALAVVLVAAAAGTAVLGLRGAARWRPGARWPATIRAAGRAAVRDPAGSTLLLLAAGAAAAMALLVPATALLVAGPLALAAVAVDLRTS